ncbi:MAG: hypothetical protein Q8J69_10085 [Sphingobacteriaceae bacterium]|nr:hypothetical protein [Sphingobacteriaceae bacterium]
MKRKMFAACALIFMLLAAPVVQAQNLLDIFINPRSQWEFSTGIGLLGWQERTVFTENQTTLGQTTSPISDRRRLSMTPDYLVDFDFKNSIRLNDQWAAVIGFGTGIMQYDVKMEDFAYNWNTNAHEYYQTTLVENNLNFSVRALIGMQYNYPLSEKHRLAIKIYGGVQPNGLENDYRIQNQGLFSFNFPDIYLRSFGGTDIGLIKDSNKTRLLLSHSSIHYRYMHFFGGESHLATHSLRGIHQLVFGWGLRQNPKADKSAYNL